MDPSNSPSVRPDHNASQPPLTKIFSSAGCAVWKSGDTLAKFDGYVCVSFSNRSIDAPELFGHGLFEKLGVPVFYVQPMGNDWHQSPEMEEVCRLIRVNAGENRILTYGSSMGGFAALLFAEALNAERCVAISPQVGIVDQLVGNFETRWREEARSIAFQWADVRDHWHPELNETVLIYDPYHWLDRQHIELIDPVKHPKVVRLPIPFAGHPATYALVFDGILSELINNLLRGKMPVRECTRLAWRAYRHSPARKYVIAIGLRIFARRTQRHREWARTLTKRYRTQGLPLKLESLRELILAESRNENSLTEPIQTQATPLAKVELKLKDLIRHAKRVQPDMLGDIPDGLATQLICGAFDRILVDLQHADRGNLNVAGLGVFQVRAVEHIKEGRVETIKRILFRVMGN